LFFFFISVFFSSFSTAAAGPSYSPPFFMASVSSSFYQLSPHSSLKRACMQVVWSVFLGERKVVHVLLVTSPAAGFAIG
jgi:hypothetical protein